MQAAPITENERSRERLVAATAALAAVPQQRQTDATPWLAQLAFWDQWALQLLRRWRSGQMPAPSVPDWYDEAVNGALAAQWRALTPAAAAQLAVEAAAAVDREVEHLETPVLAALAAAGELHLVQRHNYRDPVLTALDALLS